MFLYALPFMTTKIPKSLTGFNIGLLTVLVTTYMVQHSIMENTPHPLTYAESGMDFEVVDLITLTDINTQRIPLLLAAGCVAPHRDDRWDVDVAAEPYTSETCACLDHLFTGAPNTKATNATISAADRCFFTLDGGVSVSLVEPRVSVGIFSCVIIWNVLATMSMLWNTTNENNPMYTHLGMLIVWLVPTVLILLVEGWQVWPTTIFFPCLAIIFMTSARRRELLIDDIALPLGLVVMCILHQQRDIEYMFYTLFLGCGVVLSNLGCKRMQNIKATTNKSGKRSMAQHEWALHVIALINAVAVLLHLWVYTPSINSVHGMAFPNIRAVGFTAVLVLTGIGLTNTSFLKHPGKGPHIVQLALECTARVLITLAAIRDMISLSD
jgi:hypothetical protein